MNVAIIKYNAGNIRSVVFALDRLRVPAIVTDDPGCIKAADKVIFPGVGEASTAMKYLKERKLDELIVSLKQPVLGICLGMQLLCNDSEENDTKGLGIFNSSVRKIPAYFKVPHVGWNKVENSAASLFKGMQTPPYCFFVHSYYAEPCADTTAITDYGIKFSSALQKDNFYGLQFHPEKSATAGEQILRNFLSI